MVTAKWLIAQCVYVIYGGPRTNPCATPDCTVTCKVDFPLTVIFYEGLTVITQINEDYSLPNFPKICLLVSSDCSTF